MQSAEDSFKISQARYDEIKVNVKSLPKNGFVIFQHAAFPTNYMDQRSREIVNTPKSVTFKNYEKVYILMVGSGEFVLEYKREYIAPDAHWRNTFNYAITIYGSLALYILYFFIFEGKNVLQWLRNKLQSNQVQVRSQNAIYSSGEDNDKTIEAMVENVDRDESYEPDQCASFPVENLDMSNGVISHGSFEEDRKRK